MSDVLIRCEGVSKKFCKDLKRSLWYGLSGLAAEAMGRDRHQRTLRTGEFWAVENVSFEVRRGECVGLLGHNGAGKTTLLKMLNGLIRPDRGRIEMRGQIGAMIALGAGFNPILTGRENIYIAGSLRGMSRREIDGRLDEIIEFAGLEEFIGMPVQSYSSGMQVRLGFAIAVKMRPDILLIDEVLAVGDVGFKERAYNEIYRIINNAAVIFVSHSIPQVSKVCTRGLLMRRGSLAPTGDRLEQVIQGYFNEFTTRSTITVSGAGRLTLHRLAVCDPDGASRAVSVPEVDGAPQSPASADVEYGDNLRLEVELSVGAGVGPFALTVNFFDAELKLVAQSVSLNQDLVFEPDPRGRPQRIVLDLDRLPLNRGRYKLDCIFTAVNAEAGKITERLLRVQNAMELVVAGATLRMGAAPVQLAGAWSTSTRGGGTRRVSGSFPEDASDQPSEVPHGD